jgi:hypothetical protein
MRSSVFLLMLTRPAPLVTFPGSLCGYFGVRSRSLRHPSTLISEVKLGVSFAMQIVAQTYEIVRGSTRIRLHLPIRVTSTDPAVEFSEFCYTLIVNTQGCGVRLAQPLEPGLPVLIDELPTGLTMTARVANCVPLGSEGKYWLAGLAFDRIENIWGIQPEPEDWGVVSGPRTPAPRPPARSAWPYSKFSPRGEAHPGRK